MKRTSSQVEAEEISEFKSQFGDFATAAHEVWKFDEFQKGTVREQLKRFYGWDEDLSYVASWEFLRFFVLKAIHQDFDDEILAPSANVERVWQCLLMRPKFYYQICHTLVADLIDYNVDKSRSRERYANTLKYYEDQYNRKPDLKCWPAVEEFEENDEDVDEFKTKFQQMDSEAIKAYFKDFASSIEQISKLPEIEGGNAGGQLRRFYDWDEDLCSSAIWECMRFLVLKAFHQDFDDEVLAPSETVERVWQCLLMRPKVYYQICHTLVADLIDYNVDKTREGERYENTLKLYEEHFKRKPEAPCWASAEEFAGEEEEEEEVEAVPEETAQDVEQAMFEMIQNNVRLTPFEVKQRWGHIVSQDDLRKMWVNLIARGSLGNKQVEAPARKQKQTQASREQRRSRQDLHMRNFIDEKYIDFGEGERYYIRCKHLKGKQLTVRAPKNSLVGRVKKIVCKILPNRKPTELILTKLDESEVLDDNKGLLEYGIFKNSTFILSFAS